ncbi:SRPBCC family protein [Rothia nasisuis]|uniref:SRPBCC family protein n=1 Tax=Rothia nasisuis TaxID=2109647 RepID=UPI0034DE2548
MPLDHRQTTLERWVQVNDEDHDIVQKMHRGLASGAPKKAQLSPIMERNIVGFQNHILEKTQGE